MAREMDGRCDEMDDLWVCRQGWKADGLLHVKNNKRTTSELGWEL